MAKAKKSKSAAKPRKPVDPERAAALRRFGLHCFLLLVFIGLASLGVVSLKRHLDKTLLALPEPPEVLLVNQPAWMSDYLAQQIVAPIRPDIPRSAFDHRVLIEAVEALKTNPWIKEIRSVRRTYRNRPGDTIEIDCEFRAPIALVRWDNTFALIDEDQVRLPETFTASEVGKVIYDRHQKLVIRVIEGVSKRPPGYGQVWAGEDLAAGIDLVRVFHGQPWAEQVVRVDVGNYNGRRSPKDAHLVLGTRRGTELRWGRPINAPDAFIEVPAAQKVAYMKKLYRLGKLDQAEFAWLDLRFDQVLYPVADSAAATVTSTSTQ